MSKVGWIRPTLSRGKEAKDKIDKLLNPIPPQTNLKPLGNNFYATPPGPQEPNYDDPFSDIPIGFDFDLVSDECNIGIQITGSLAFIKLPSFQFVWRNPDCTPRKEPFELPESIPMPSSTGLYWRLKYQPYYVTCREQIPHHHPTLIIGGYGYNFRGSIYSGSENKESINTQILFVTGEIESNYINGIGTVYTWFGEVIYKAKRTRHRVGYSYSGTKVNIFGVVDKWSERIELPDINESLEGIFKTKYTDTGWEYAECLSGDDDSILRAIALNFGAVNLERFGAIPEDEINEFIEERDRNEQRKFYEKYFHEAYFGEPTWTAEKASQNTATYFKYLDGDGNINFGLPYSLITTRAYAYTYIYVSDGTLDLSQIPVTNQNIEFKCNVPVPPAPLPPTMKKECCDEVLAMLALLLKRVGNLPAFVPDLYTNASPQLIKKESLAELILWSAKQLDAVSGKYPLEVTIQDIDPNKKGNQSQKIELPNQAELLADIYQAVLLSKQINEALLPIALKTLVETGSIKLTAIATHDLAYGNADFLGWDIVHTKDKVKFGFNPTADPESPMSELLEQTEIEVKGYENKDKKDFRTWIMPIMRMASAWMAQNFRKVPDAEALKATLGDTPDRIIYQAEKDKKDEEDFDVFVENVEKGFVNISGITDTVNPYGHPFEERPKIREIGGGDNVTD